MRTKPGKKYGCKLCKLMYDQTVKLWNSQWLDREMRKMIVDPDVVNHKIAKKMPFAASVEEVSVFAEYDDWGMGEFGEFGSSLSMRVQVCVQVCAGVSIGECR